MQTLEEIWAAERESSRQLGELVKRDAEETKALCADMRALTEEILLTR